MKTKLFLFILAIVSTQAIAQDMFYRTFAEQNFSNVFSVNVLPNNDYVFTGESFVVTDYKGEVKSNTWLTDELLFEMIPATNSTYIGVGLVANGVGPIIKKVTSSGANIWLKNQKAGICSALTQTPNGNIYATGGAFTGGIMVISLLPNGNTNWSKVFTDSLGVRCSSQNITYTSDNNLLVTGLIGNQSSSRMILLMKITPAGNILWSRTFDTPDKQVINDVIETSDGGFILAGTTYDTSGYGNENIHVIKTTSTGALVWSKAFGDSEDDEAIAITSTSDGNYAIACQISHVDSNPPPACKPNPCTDALIIKITEQGDTLWTRAYGDYQSEWVRDFISTPDNGFLILGTTPIIGLNTIVPFAFKLDNHGNSECYSYRPDNIKAENPPIQTSQRTMQSQPLSLNMTTTTGNYWPRSPLNKAPICTSIGLEDFEKTEKEISISPNPSSGEVSLSIGEHYSEATIFVREISGKTICTYQFSDDEPIKVNLMGPSGVYILELHLNGSYKTQLKALKN